MWPQFWQAKSGPLQTSLKNFEAAYMTHNLCAEAVLNLLTSDKGEKKSWECVKDPGLYPGAIITKPSSHMKRWHIWSFSVVKTIKQKVSSGLVVLVWLSLYMNAEGQKTRQSIYCLTPNECRVNLVTEVNSQAFSRSFTIFSLMLPLCFSLLNLSCSFHFDSKVNFISYGQC